MKLSTNFYLYEFIRSQTATRRGIDNSADVETVNNLKALCHNILEPVRRILDNHPMHITSGYRSPALNKTIGGSQTSAHMDGLAADFICPAYGTPREVAERIMASDIEYDQLIWEGDWIHISHDSTPRRQTLTARFEDGSVSYRVGIV